MYPESKIVICEPWTLATLRERVASHPDIRRKHIDPLIESFVSERVEERLERFAAQQQRWSEQTDAALAGPLRVCGQHEAAAEAQAAVQRRDWPAAADLYEQLAQRVRARFPSVADALLLRAARTADEIGDRPRAARLYLVVSASAARRGDSTADFAAFRASWLLSDDERWRAHAAMARATWVEQPEDNVDALVAFSRGCDENLEDLEEWTAAATAALLAQGDWTTTKDLAERAVLRLGPVRGAGTRLELELDLLDASAALGEDTGHRLRKLSLSDVGRQAEAAAQIAARWGCIEARRGRLDEACAHFREAAARWREVPAEDEIAEAVFSEHSARQLLGDANGVDQVDRIAAAELRGSHLTDASHAERRMNEGLAAWLEDRGFDARRNLTSAWSLHRRAGNLAGTLRCARALTQLFRRADDHANALRWTICAGDMKDIHTLAARVPWPEAMALLRLDGAPWEQRVSCEAIAAGGVWASDEDTAALVDRLLELAADVEDLDGWNSRGLGAAARRALATLLCAIPQSHLPQALELVKHEIEAAPFPPREAAAGLLMATAAGRAEEHALIADVYCAHDAMGLSLEDLAEHLLGHSPEGRQVVERWALQTGGPALRLAARLRLPDEVPALARMCEQHVIDDLAGATASGEALRNDDRGLFARWAEPDAAQAMARRLIDRMADVREIDAQRREAAGGLKAVADALPPVTASAVLDDLLRQAHLIETASENTGTQSGPARHFARVRMNAPIVHGAVRAGALTAACELAARSGRSAELREELAAAMNDESPYVRGAALQAVERHPALAEDFNPLGHADDQDHEVATIATLFAARTGRLGDDHTRLEALGRSPDPSSRARVLAYAREAAEKHRRLLQILAVDEFAYIRAAARSVLALK